MSWGDAGFEPGTAGQQSSALPLSHHTFPGELENNSRKPRDLTKSRHSGSLKRSQLALSQGMVNKGDDVAVDDNDDAMRSSVLRNQVTMTLCSQESFPRVRTHYI